MFIATTVILSFISFWRAAAIVLSDLASSAFYADGNAEKVIGKTAPWFILAVMLFSYAVRAVYSEASSMFVRGGVYRVVRQAMGDTLAKRRNTLPATCMTSTSSQNTRNSDHGRSGAFQCIYFRIQRAGSYSTIQSHSEAGSGLVPAAGARTVPGHDRAIADSGLVISPGIVRTPA